MKGYEPKRTWVYFVLKVINPLYQTSQFQKFSSIFYKYKYKVKNCKINQFIDKKTDLIRSELDYIVQSMVDSHYFRRKFSNYTIFILLFTITVFFSAYHEHDNRVWYYRWFHAHDKYMNYVNRTSDKNYLLERTIDKMIKEQLEKGELDILGWISLGSYQKGKENMELAYSNYYMAHLLDHKIIKTNSEMEFSLMPNKEGDDKKTIDKILESLKEEQE